MEELWECQDVFEQSPTPRQLPIITLEATLGAEAWFVDFRLSEIRQVTNPHRVRAWDDLSLAERDVIRRQLEDFIA